MHSEDIEVYIDMVACVVAGLGAGMWASSIGAGLVGFVVAVIAFRVTNRR